MNFGEWQPQIIDLGIIWAKSLSPIGAIVSLLKRFEMVQRGPFLGDAKNHLVLVTALIKNVISDMFVPI